MNTTLIMTQRQLEKAVVVVGRVAPRDGMRRMLLIPNGGISDTASGEAGKQEQECEGDGEGEGEEGEQRRRRRRRRHGGIAFFLLVSSSFFLLPSSFFFLLLQFSPFF